MLSLYSNRFILKFITLIFILLTLKVSAQVQELISPNEREEGGFGISVSGIPDVNGDGFGDVIVGASQEETGASMIGGRAYIFDGSTGNLLYSLLSTHITNYGYFGCSVSGIPDLNGDNRGDVIVGARLENPIGLDSGRAYVFNGATGNLLYELISPNSDTGCNFGCSVSGVPDVNNDGMGDIIIGALGECIDIDRLGCGRAYVFNGLTHNLLHTLISPNAEMNGQFGFSVSGIPDVNGDGFGDIIIGTPYEDPGSSPEDAGRAYVFSGATGNLIYELSSPNEQYLGNFGGSVSGIPDVDGDELGEIIVGAEWEYSVGSPTCAGKAYIFDGSTGALLNELISPNQKEYGTFGFSVSGIPDINGDGLGDVVVGAILEGIGVNPNGSGRAYIFDGSTGNCLYKFVSPNEEEDGHLGYSVSGISDVNGDNWGDVIISAINEDPGASPNKAGRAYIFSGISFPTYTKNWMLFN